ncbi:MAG: hypothetical protein V1777_01550 [Candidatus Micrarchaeota archaeon]
MKLSKDQWIIAGLAVAIIVLAGIALFLATQKNSGIGATMAKTFSDNVHAGLADMNAQTADLVATMQQTAPPLDHEAEYARLYALAVSNEEEVLWIMQKETPLYETLQKSENNIDVMNALQKETAVFALVAHLGIIQDELVSLLSDENVTPDETIALAEQELPNIQIKNFVSPENVTVIANETGLSEQQVRDGDAQMLREYIDFKKTRFETETLEDFKLVEAHKLLAWRYILESLPDQ